MALEYDILRGGRERLLARLLDAEQAGRADTTPYARPLYRRWLLPLIDAVHHALDTTGKPGRHKAHVGLLKPLEPTTIAFVGMNTALCLMMSDKAAIDARKLSRAVGTALYRELLFTAFAHESDALYWAITHALERRYSRSAQYKTAVLQNAARAHDVGLPEWTAGMREQAGAWLVECLRALGFISVSRRREKRLGGGMREYLTAHFSDAALGVIGNIKEMAALLMPLHVPFIEPPRDWTAFNQGGYHTRQMRRLWPACIASPRTHRKQVLDVYRRADLSKVRAAINHLQAVRWQINTDMLDTVRQIAARVQTDEIVQVERTDPPPRPAWLTGEMARADMTDVQAAEFTTWKQHMRQWHNDQRSRCTKFQRFHYALLVAGRFAAYPVIYFLYQADFRGRLYAVTTGVNPQGSDLQRALLRFAQGKPLATPAAQAWFKVDGANRFGVDKVSFAQRIQWVNENHRHIMDMADDPLAHDGWQEADKPMQFLAWCKEYAAWQRNPDTFVSHLPVGMDGSCNGLQHFSAMLRDEVGGAAVNLTPASAPRDIYQQVADGVRERLAALDTCALPEAQQALARKWQAHGVSRQLVKRSVMTLPYGATRFSCAQFIVDDYLAKGCAPEFAQGEHMKAAHFLSHLVWATIAAVVVAAPRAMDWLRQCAGELIGQGLDCIRWTAPSGFPVVQTYFEADTLRVNSMLMGGMQITVAQAGDTPHKRRHQNGIAPNFVHSMDAAHLTLTVNEAARQGIGSLAMIHDDYGTHAADAATLAVIIRETFVQMYEHHQPLTWFRDHYTGLPDPPATGQLDVRRVRQSEYFFA